MKKPLRMAILTICATLPLTVVTPLPAQAAPATRETATLKIDRNCLATVTGRWYKEPTAPVQPIDDLGDRTNGHIYGLGTGSGPWKTTDSLTRSLQLDPSDTAHVIYGQLELDGTTFAVSPDQTVFCSVPAEPS